MPFSPFPIAIFIIKFLQEFENFGEHVYFILSEKAFGFSLLFLPLFLFLSPFLSSSGFHAQSSLIVIFNPYILNTHIYI